MLYGFPVCNTGFGGKRSYPAFISYLLFYVISSEKILIKYIFSCVHQTNINLHQINGSRRTNTFDRDDRDITEKSWLIGSRI